MRVSARKSKAQARALVLAYSDPTAICGRSLLMTRAKKQSHRQRIARAERVGEEIGKIAKEKNISALVFDRGGNKYHGRVKAVADGARKAGIKL